MADLTADFLRQCRQMTLASTRGTDAYEQAVLEGREVPNIFMGLDTKYGNR